MKILVLGANGYTGARLISELIRQGHQVRGLVRTLERGAELERQGMELRVGDVARPEDIRTIADGIEVIFNLVAYCRAETPAMRAALVEGTRNLLRVLDRAALKKYIWTSSVSVYGHPKAPARLDEDSPLKPDYPVGRATAEVEQQVRSELPSVTIRVTSVYGPGRDYIDAVRAGRVRLLNGGRNWQSRIHVQDLVSVLLAALDRGASGATYLAGDDLPTTAQLFFGELSEALRVPPPPTLEVNAARAVGAAGRALNWLAGQPQIQLSENLIGLLTGNYNCSNERLKRELGVELKYPTFRDGYEEILRGGF